MERLSGHPVSVGPTVVVMMMLLLVVLPAAATSDSLLHSAAVTYSAATPDFSVTATPTSVTVNPGTPGTSTINVAATNAFTGTVALVENGGAACSLSGASVSLTPTTTSGSVTLTCAYAAAGNNSVAVTVTGTSGSLSHSATVTFQIVDFTIAANPISIIVNAGSPSTSTITATAVNVFTGIVALSQDGGAACSLNVASVTLTATTSSGSVTLTCTFAAPGFGVAVTGTSGPLSHSATVAFQVVDFTIAASPTSVVVNAGRPGTSTITVTAQSGLNCVVVLCFTGIVALSEDGGAACSVSAASVTLTEFITSGGAALTCTFAAQGTNLVTVTGTSGSLSHSASVTFNVGPQSDFTITASPASFVVNAGSHANSTITVSAVGVFTGNVDLAVVFQVGQNRGAGCSLPAAPVTLTATTTSSSVMLTCTFTAGGNNSLTVTGTSGSLSHSATVAFQVVDFIIAASPTSVSVNPGSPGTSITVTSVNGFTGTVALSQNGGFACSLSVASVSLTFTTTSGSTTLTCTHAAVGFDSVIVTGTSGSLYHSATITVTVTLPAPPKAPEKPATILGLEPLTLYGVIGVLAAVVITGLLALRRKRARPFPTQLASSHAQPA